jgi:hypothetical protein
VGDPSVLLVQIGRECIPPYLSTGISNLLQPAQAEGVLGQLSMYSASWAGTVQFMRISHTISDKGEVLIFFRDLCNPVFS